MIAGVCAGLAEYLGVDPTLIRLAFVLLLFAGTGGFWLYVIMWIVVPVQPEDVANSIEVNEKKTGTENPQVIEVKPVDEKEKKD
jgi:phage shock protein C